MAGGEGDEPFREVVEELAARLGYDSADDGPSGTGEQRYAVLAVRVGRLALEQFESEGALDVLDDCIAAFTIAVELGRRDPDLLDELAHAHGERFRAVGLPADLDAAVRFRGDSVRLTRPGTWESADRQAWLAEDLLLRFDTRGEVGDVTEAVGAAEVAVAEARGYAEQPEHQRLHASTLLARFERLGNTSDLDAAQRLAVRAVEAAKPERAWRHLAGLGNLLTVRFTATGEREALEEAVRTLRECVVKTPPEAPDSHVGAGNLAHALCLRYDRLGDLADLDEAIGLAHRAVRAAQAAGDADHAAHWQGTLGAARRMRYALTHVARDALAAVEHQQEAVRRLEPGHPELPRRLTELGAALREHYMATGEFPFLEQSIRAHLDALDATPAGHPERPSWQASLGNAYLELFQHSASPSHLDQAARHLAAAVEAMREDDPERPRRSGALAAGLHLLFETRGAADILDTAIASLARILDDLPEDHQERPAGHASLGEALLDRYELRGDANDLRMATRLLTDSDRPASLASALHAEYLRSADPRTLDQAVNFARTALDVLPDGHAHRPWALNNLASYLLTRCEAARSRADADDAALLLMDARDDIPEGSRPYATLLVNLGRACLAQYRFARDRADRTGSGPEGIDTELLGDAAAVFEAALRMPGAPEGVRDTAAELLARTARHAHASDHVSLRTANHWLREAADRLAERQGSRRRAGVMLEQARLLRLRGEHQQARVRAREALRGRTWDVLVQSSPEDAFHCARQAVDEAGELTAWCLEDGALEEALSAIEGARALVLHAVTTRSRIADLLQARGLTELRQEWLAAVARRPASGRADIGVPRGPLGTPNGSLVPDDIRVRVLHALAEPSTPTADRSLADLLDTPSAEATAAACVRLGVDAVVHLVQGAEGAQGWALVLHADGRLAALPLPGLVRESGPLERFLAAHDRHLTRTQEAERQWRTALRAVCDWAWNAVIGQIAEHLGPTAGAPRRTPRVVLVPTGSLALVPWHAARRRAAGPGGPRRYRYAIEDLAISYAPSARMLLAFSDTALLPLDDHGFVVADPLGDLPHARREAEDIHRRHYAKGRILGRAGAAPTPPATPRAVLSAFASDDATAAVLPSVVHLACHGLSRIPPTDSHLLLAGGQKLAVSRLLEHASPRMDRRGPLAVLSACATAVPGGQYDEALSLATAFATMGAAAVVGSLWPVGDASTSALMTDFHALLNADGHPPGEALRLAQLRFLERVSGSATRGGSRARIRAEDPWYWAAFIHYGKGYPMPADHTTSPTTQPTDADVHDATVDGSEDTRAPIIAGLPTGLPRVLPWRCPVSGCGTTADGDMDAPYDEEVCPRHPDQALVRA